MDLLKQLTGKNPAEYEAVAKHLVDDSDVKLFEKLVNQDDFLFDFVKDNVAKRIALACNAQNYQNLLNFLDFYSPSYDTVIAETLYKYGGIEILPLMREIFLDESVSKKAYAVKYFSFVPKEYIQEMLPVLRQTAWSDFEPLAINSIEVLSIVNDEESKKIACEKLVSTDEFEQYEAVKFLVTFKALDVLPQIIELMKKSSLAENIASEIPYLIPIEDLLEKDFESAILVLCNIINAIPEIISPTAVLDYNLFGILENLYISKLNSFSAVLLRLAKAKFEELVSNEEYLFDVDKNTKEEVFAINRLLSGVNIAKLESLFYEELYDGSDFVFFAIDFVEDITELETLLDSKNQTLVMKILTLLKEKGQLSQAHKDIAMNNVSREELKNVINAL